ncbi:hypothetical protein A2334_02675 [Candidatus Roizmanbacteria bacterium RIFOXYB2_FULL_38_10]|uniref:Excinuclease ABC subunit C n=1 Tax=Candidatus Roizmanbacteria bacterium RIFOXYD1_FULL_38_12 TaxID=1802093 RepID=A0A1F7L0L4_9BACT|nr:MAG: hypothetical protein A3K47_02325 [Candidatus Roizmanbacteria bacterium RIFOXYA2_FULL_38_14]OGK63613.1 MAG: hypothetical protein A3K27_02325 [Candidatus Roizmanbacteria bacterium RIFOXYA1_FULL_37_12]OGK65459.1 MAG: hypothetical protein A3K38_02325 [Candidatus Roizmanbacteria bacterium RIFOXYB1_FULL_40_23]OGK69064.1 MAG: hypothetical protein A2334_02675 [Candidatus Roizmanbacteria bacterium RIFOXYB2_FULL_38_10]OGK69864.1 MAG: hypothetical protein A3K21_02330 [Candidatus Roizmanbacteria ba
MKQLFHIPRPLEKQSYVKLPSTHGVYIFKQDNTYLYIGKSVNIKARVLSHVENSLLNKKEQAIVSQTNTVETISTDSEFKALLLESQLIQKHYPKYNVIWRDGKSHLYIKITHEVYPKITAVRKENDGKSLYFGPFSSSIDVMSLLRFIRRLFPYCAQKKITSKPCFYSKIHLCDPCPNNVETLHSREKLLFKRKYKANIRKIISLLKGNTKQVEKALNQDLKQTIANQDYEKGIKIRNQIQTLYYLLYNLSFKTYTERDFDTTGKSLHELKQLLLPYFPSLSDLSRIECFDVSNLNGKQATASMVVMTKGHIDKGEYRKFKIKNLSIRSDFEMLSEALVRRFSNSWISPNLLVMDGGKPQVKTALQIIKKLHINIPLIGIAKRPDRIVIGIEKYPTIRPSINNLGYRLIQAIRDESHRFARKYHLLLRNHDMI